MKETNLATLEPQEVEDFGGIIEDSMRRLLAGEPQNAAAIARANRIIENAKKRQRESQAQS